MFNNITQLDSVDSDLFVPDMFATQPEFGSWLASETYVYDTSLSLDKS